MKEEVLIFCLQQWATQVFHTEKKATCDDGSSHRDITEDGEEKTEATCKVSH